MNPRRVHELMLHHFPALDSVDLEWVVAVDEDGPRMKVIEALIDRFIEGDDLIIEVHRKEGDCLNRTEARDYIARNASAGLKVADRKFTGFVVISPNGVAAGWTSKSARQSNDLRDYAH